MRNNSFFSPIVDSVRHWYVPLIVGILFLLSAIFAFSKPLQVFVSLAVFMGVSLMISGVSEIFFAFRNRQGFSQWAWHFVMGTLTFIISIMLLKDLELSFNVLALYIGLMFMFRAIAGISLSLDLKKYGIKNCTINESCNCWSKHCNAYGFYLHFHRSISNSYGISTA